MKQGSAPTVNSGRKVEPSSSAMSVKGVSQIGTALGNHATDVSRNLANPSKELYKGRGFEAPMNKSTQHHSGSQRRTD